MTPQRLALFLVVSLAGGLALVLMEALNDLGATEYLGVRTLTVSAYQTWLQRSSLAGAAEILDHPNRLPARDRERHG